jgi:hypothetical protein
VWEADPASDDVRSSSISRRYDYEPIIANFEKWHEELCRRALSAASVRVTTMARFEWIRRVRARCSPALVVACVALLVALGGTSYATVIAVPASSVGTVQLKPQAVTAAKLAPNAVRTGNVANGTLLSDDFKPGQLPASGLAVLQFASVSEQVNVPSTTPVRVASLDVPAGTYLVTAALTVFTDALFCKLQANGVSAGGNGTDGSIVLLDRLAFSTPSKVEVWCQRGPVATFAVVFGSKIAALQVAG